MKKYLSLAVSAITLFSALQAGATSVGDIYFHDKTSSADLVDGKVPIGLVYFVDPSSQHGYVMALNQPAAANLANANTYCSGYTTLGTSIGDWRMSDFLDGMQMMKQSWNGVSNDKFVFLNTKLTAIPGYGEALIADTWYHVLGTSTTVSYIIKMNLGEVTLSNGAGYSYRFRCVMQF